jgi:hypothetical protein
MQNLQPDSAFVVVVMRGTGEISRTTWPTAADAERYMTTVRDQGVPAANVRIYRTRLARPSSPDLGIAR